MQRLSRLGAFALGWMLFIAACRVPGGELQVAETAPERATSTRVNQNETAAETSVATVETGLSGPSPQLEETPALTPTVSSPDQPNEVEVGQVEVPPATVVAVPEDVVTDEAVTDRGASEEQLRLLASLGSYGPAPELHNEAWLNSEPLRLADLRGKVVLVEFWTFG